MTRSTGRHARRYMRNSKKPETKKPKKVDQTAKTKFRRSPEWKKLRNQVKEEQKFDPITGKPLSTTYNLHHRNCNPDRYFDISDREKFIGVNSTTHDVLHYFWGDSRYRKDWRTMVMKLIHELKKMDLAYDGELEYPED